MSVEWVMPSSHLILCRPLLLPPITPSIKVFSNESTLRMRWPKYCSFSFSIIPFKEHPGLISLRMDWLDLLAVQGMLKTFYQWDACCSVSQPCPTLCDPIDCSMSGFPVLHHLPELAQTHIHLWYHQTISSSVIPFSCFQSFPAGVFFKRPEKESF